MTTIVTTRQRLPSPFLLCIILCIIPSPYFCYAETTGMMMNTSTASNTTATTNTNTSNTTSINTTTSPKNTLVPIPSEPPREPQQPRPDQINDCRTWGCSNHGTCDHLSYTCQCDEHYTGSLCAIHVNPCPDGIQTCYNGALCVPKRDQKQPPASSSAPTQAPVAWDWDKEREKMQLEQAMSDLATDDALFNLDYNNDKYGNALYECQCVQHEQSFPLFDGDQCQHPLYTSCQLDSLRSDFAFCLNDGVCKQRVAKGTRHQGCNCLHNWTGFYCQLPPKEDQHTIPITNIVQPESSSSNDKIVIAFVCIISLVFCCSLAAFVYYSRRAAAARDPSTADNEVVTLDDIEELEENTLGRRRTTGQVRAEREIS